MIAASLTAALALLSSASEQPPVPQERPYSAVSSGPVRSGPINDQTRLLSDSDAALFRQGLTAARARDVIGARNAAAQIGDPVARKLVEWALLDTSAEQLPWSDLSVAQSSFSGWPRGDGRRVAAERALDLANAGPDAALGFFGEGSPVSVQGAIALASALEQSGRGDEARRLITEWWRTRSFDDAFQNRILTRWGGWLTQDDHDARLGVLLLGPHGPATRAMVQRASPGRRAVAEAVMALRTAYSPDAIV
ncbi:MAG TPA: lytic transglycosylase domain-containing protein, partial [Brevundimonas sp.]|nr:lytic transglycosylase domain-containing protein [Brevundimonas sp.]